MTTTFGPRRADHARGNSSNNEYPRNAMATSYITSFNKSL